MRHGRAKAARKTLQFFARQGVRAPYVVLVDGTFLVQSVLMKVPVMERMDKILQHNQYSLQVTRSCLNELQVLAQHAPATKQDAIQQARQWGLDECEIIEPNDIPSGESSDNVTLEELGLPGQDVVKLVQSHSTSFIVATQDETLLDILRGMGLCPLLRLSRGVLLLENPSKVAQQRAHYQETKKYSHAVVNKSERMLAQSVRDEDRSHAQQQNAQHTRVKRKAKGPNPLSCKKKKTNEETKLNKRKRRRKGNKSEESGVA